MSEKLATLVFPTGGLNKRLGFQAQPPFTTPDCSNVMCDGPLTERERGGMRRALGKLLSTQFGSGNPIRMLGSVRYTASGVIVSKLVLSSNGIVYLLNADEATVTTISSNTTLSGTAQLQCVDYQQKLYIADYGPTLAEDDDGVIGGGSLNELTSSGVGDFAADGVNDDDHFVVITSHAAVNEVQTITVDATGGTFRVTDPETGNTTDLVSESVTAANLEDALEVIYGTGNVTVSGSAGGPYTVTFAGDLAGRRMELMETQATFLTGGAGTAVVARSTRGASTVQYAGTYNITTVATTTVTIGKTLQALTGVNFYIGRCPKVLDPVAGTLTKWLQDDYTYAEAEDAGDLDLEGEAKGAIPIGRTLIATFHNRLFLGGGIYSPNSFDCCRIGDPDDWDVSQEDAARAVLGSVDDAGRIAEPITALIPHQQSCMIIAGKGSLWVLRGDITAGGIVNLDQTIGILSGQAWCQANDVLYFTSTNGVYMMAAPCGGNPISVSKPKLPQEFRNIDPATYHVVMGYCDDQDCVDIWVTKISQTTASQHWKLKIGTTVHGEFANAFFPMTLANYTFEAFQVFAWNDQTSDHSTLIIGSRDGYLRRFRRDLAQDDGSNFTSYVKIGPINLGGKSVTQQGRLNQLRAIIPASSGDVDVDVYVGDSAELALAATPASFEFNTVGHSPSRYVCLSGSAAFFHVKNGESGARWELEALTITVLPAGGVKP